MAGGPPRRSQTWSITQSKRDLFPATPGNASEAPQIVRNAASIVPHLDQFVSSPKQARQQINVKLEDASLDAGGDPIIDAQANPFKHTAEERRLDTDEDVKHRSAGQSAADATSDHVAVPATTSMGGSLKRRRSRRESEDDFQEDVYVVKYPEGKIFMRALLDTGMTYNAMSYEKAMMTGLKMLPSDGGTMFRDADGEPFSPVGTIEAQFHFHGRLSRMKTWNVTFYVLSNPPFDVALGTRFIKMSGCIKREDTMLPLFVTKTKNRQERDAQKETEKKEEERHKREMAKFKKQVEEGSQKRTDSSTKK